MARPTEGWRLVKDRRTGVYFVRFRHDGKRCMRSTGSRSLEQATGEAEVLYAEVASGRVVPERAEGGVRTDKALDVLAAEWLTAIQATIDPKTYDLYMCYVTAHWIPFFGGLERMLGAGGDGYWRQRLRSVQVVTVRKEVSALRSFLGWCKEQGHVDEVPAIKGPGRRAVGTVKFKRKPVCLTADQVDAILAKLPERTQSRKHPEEPEYFVRARIAFQWETGLRPEMVDQLSVPDNYTPGAKYLTVSAGDDKNRMARVIPLTERARAALDEAAPKQGLIFGKHDYRHMLRKAAREAGLDPRTADRVTVHCFRHSRITFWAETSGDNLTGVQYLAGHTRASTTERYIKTSLRAAEAVLARHTGCETGCGDRTRLTTAAAAEPIHQPFRGVRGGGLEPHGC
jgi:integrase